MATFLDEGYYPIDVDAFTEDNYLVTVEQFKELVETGAEDECWNPHAGRLIQSRFTHYGTRNPQTMSMILMGPIYDASRRAKTVVSICGNPICCNPNHLTMISKRNKIHGELVESLTQDEWKIFLSKFHLTLSAYKNRIAMLTESLQTIQSETKWEEANAELEYLHNNFELPYKTVVRTMLLNTGNKDIDEQFLQYLVVNKILTAYQTLNQHWRGITKQMLMASRVEQDTAKYFDHVICAVAKLSGNQALKSYIQVNGLEEEISWLQF